MSCLCILHLDSWIKFLFIVFHLPKDYLVIVRDDAPDSLMILQFFLMMTSALLRISGSHLFCHFVKYLVSFSVFLGLHDLEVFLEELDVFNLFLS